MTEAEVISKHPLPWGTATRPGGRLAVLDGEDREIDTVMLYGHMRQEIENLVDSVNAGFITVVSALDTLDDLVD